MDTRFRHVMSTLASRPMTPVVGRLPSSFTSLSRKEKPSLPGSDVRCVKSRNMTFEGTKRTSEYDDCEWNCNSNNLAPLFSVGMIYLFQCVRLFAIPQMEAALSLDA
ncbi:hypothetical protein OUZ56_027920 [Daphnia magna]|uniref:Uncharacterized protein n=1 Tax=Daphnia magna TaxID=35525 RepID=A0ABR0B2B4_9CRUS|nr:hypothetical protein OUZ56_027920 [Daphnia magna]